MRSPRCRASSKTRFVMGASGEDWSWLHAVEGNVFLAVVFVFNALMFVPLGHLADLIWRWKALLVYLGAALIAASLLIMIGLLNDPVAIRLPVQFFQPHAAANHRLLLPVRLVNHGRSLRA